MGPHMLSKNFTTEASPLPSLYSHACIFLDKLIKFPRQALNSHSSYLAFREQLGYSLVPAVIEVS